MLPNADALALQRPLLLPCCLGLDFQLYLACQLWVLRAFTLHSEYLIQVTLQVWAQIVDCRSSHLVHLLLKAPPHLLALDPHLVELQPPPLHLFTQYLVHHLPGYCPPIATHSSPHSR